MFTHHNTHLNNTSMYATTMRNGYNPNGDDRTKPALYVPRVMVTQFKCGRYFFKVPTKFNVSDVFDWHFELRAPFIIDTDSEEVVAEYEASELFKEIGGYQVEVIYVHDNKVLFKNLNQPAGDSPTLVWYDVVDGESHVINTTSVTYMYSKPKVVTTVKERVVFTPVVTNAVLAGFDAAIDHTIGLLMGRLVKTPSNYAITKTAGDLIKKAFSFVTPDDIPKENLSMVDLVNYFTELANWKTFPHYDMVDVSKWKKSISKVMPENVDERLFEVGWVLGKNIIGDSELSVKELTRIIAAYK